MHSNMLFNKTDKKSFKIFKIVNLVYRCAGFSWCSRCAAPTRARCVRPSSSSHNKFIAGVVDTGEQLIACVVDTGDKHSFANISANFRKKSKPAPMEYLGAWGTLIHEKNLKSKISCKTPYKIVNLVYRCAGFSWCSRCAAPTRARCVRPSSSSRSLTRLRRSFPRRSWPLSHSCKLLRHARASNSWWFNADPDSALFLIADPDPGRNPGFWWP